MPEDDAAVRARVARLEALLADLEARAEPALRARLDEALAQILALHGEALARVLAHAERLGARALHRALAADEWVGALLLLHGLHPDTCEARVTEALAAVRPTLHAHGGDVELLGVADGVVRLRLRGACRGCASAERTLRDTIEGALRAAAPEVVRIETEGAAPADTVLVPLDGLVVESGPGP